MIELDRILCPVDFSPFSERALIYAVRMAQWYDAKLFVHHVMPPLPDSIVSELALTSRQLIARNLLSLVEKVRLPGVEIETSIVESVDAASKIVQTAEALDVDLIVTGSHGRSGVQRAILGSVVETMLHRCGRPVLVVPSRLDASRVDGDVSLSRILCAVDFAAASLSGLAYALSIAEETDATLTLLHVIDVPPELEQPPQPPFYDVAPIRAQAEAESLSLLRALIPVHARDYCTIETAVIEGGASRQILRVAEQSHSDLIVLGVHSRKAVDLAVFGSNSKDVIRQAHCPVLVVPAARRSSLRAAS